MYRYILRYISYKSKSDNIYIYIHKYYKNKWFSISKILKSEKLPA